MLLHNVVLFLCQSGWTHLIGFLNCCASLSMCTANKRSHESNLTPEIIQLFLDKRSRNMLLNCLPCQIRTSSPYLKWPACIVTGIQSTVNPQPRHIRVELAPSWASNMNSSRMRKLRVELVPIKVSNARIYQSDQGPVPCHIAWYGSVSNFYYAQWY